MLKAESSVFYYSFKNFQQHPNLMNVFNKMFWFERQQKF